MKIWRYYKGSQLTDGEGNICNTKAEFSGFIKRQDIDKKLVKIQMELKKVKPLSDYSIGYRDALKSLEEFLIK